jgi:hypothetical protein
MRFTSLLIVSILAAALGMVAIARGSERAPRLDPGRFTAKVTNPWFPLHPGTRYVYQGLKDGKPSHEVVTVTGRTRTIGGVPTTAVQDRLYVLGRLHERTTDWYAQDRQGNVWYFGEDTAELDRSGRVVSTEGTWLDGVNGARAGIYIPGNPTVGMTARQEYYKGHAEDHFRVVAVLGTVGAGAPNAVVTEEWTPLEPGVLDHKTYVRGIGTVLELAVKGGTERNELRSVSRGA